MWSKHTRKGYFCPGPRRTGTKIRTFASPILRAVVEGQANRENGRLGERRLRAAAEGTVGIWRTLGEPLHTWAGNSDTEDLGWKHLDSIILVGPGSGDAVCLICHPAKPPIPLSLKSILRLF